MEAKVLITDESLKVKFRKDYKFLRFYFLPFLSDFTTDVRWMAEKVEISLEKAFEYQDTLLNAGYWARTPSGGLSAKENHPRFKRNFDDVLSVSEFMTLNANIIARISDTGPCWYETFTIATTEALEKEFIHKLNALLKDFREKSQEQAGDILISWSQIYTHALSSTADLTEEEQ